MPPPEDTFPWALGFFALCIVLSHVVPPIVTFFLYRRRG